jgi:hypothetical protein
MARTPQKKGSAPAQSKKIFAIDEESRARGTSYCWVECHKDGYHLFGNDLGEMCEPTGIEADGFDADSPN